jgi:copper transport protein
MRTSIHRRPALWLGALGTALVGLLLGPTLASAHAYIVRTSPGMGAVLAHPPTTVRLWFDEPVTPAVRNPLVVRDARRQQVDRGDAAIDPDDATELVCHLRRLLPGVYTVSWRVISADTHVVHGAFTFRVGHGAAPPAPAPAEASGVGAFDSSAPLPSLLRWISLLGAITGVGGLLFQRLTIPSNSRDMAARGAAWDILGRRARATALSGLAVLLLVAGPALLVQAADAADVALRAAVDPTILGATLVHSRWGLAWLVRVGLALLLVAAVGMGGRTARHGATLLVAALLLLTFSVAGHAAGYGNPVQEGVAIGFDWVHLVGAAAWLGGLAVLAVGLRPALHAVASDERRPFLGALIPRFSRIAVASVLALLATGIYVTWLRLPGWGAFVATVYGQTLLVKLLLSLPLLALGGVNFWMGRGERGDLLSRTLGGLLARVGGWVR